MLDVRVYRAAFLPALVVLFVAAFSLADRPPPVRSAPADDAFSGVRAFGGPTPERNSLRELAAAFPDRRPGSAGDRGLADRVAAALGARDGATGRPTFMVSRLRTPGGDRDTGALETVVGVRPGLSNHRVVVLASRDAPASAGRPARAQLSATAALLEVARAVRARDLTKTLVLVSTSGASTGSAGARAWARRAAATGPVDGVLVLGDLASARTRRPYVVPWSGRREPAPLHLQRTVESAVRRATGRDPGGAGAAAQWIRRALPATISEQAAVGSAGLPAVLLSASGERGPEPGARVSRRRLGTFGRAALRAVAAMDAAPVGGDAQAGALSGGPQGIVAMRNVLPEWAIRLLIGALLLPALLTALDAFFRARRRHLPVGPWLLWLGAAAAPVVAAWLWTRLLGVTGAVHAPPFLASPAALAIGAGGGVALGSAVAVGALAWLGLRPFVRAGARSRGNAAAGGLAAASGLVLVLVTALAWVVDPYLAALLLPAAHGWLFAAAPHGRLPLGVAVLAVLGGLVAPALVVVYYGLTFAAGPLALGWLTLLGTAAGHVSVVTLLVVAGFLASLAGVVRALAARRRVRAVAPPERIRTRGPLTYAGPGSLGGTESALRR